MSSDSLSKYNESLELIAQKTEAWQGAAHSAVNNKLDQSGTSSMVIGGASKPSPAGKQARKGRHENASSVVKGSMTGLNKNSSQGRKSPIISKQSSSTAAREEQKMVTDSKSTTTGNAIRNPSSGAGLSSKQGQGGEQLFTIVKNQSKDKRKIEIQHNLQRKRDNSLVLNNQANLNNSSVGLSDEHQQLNNDRGVLLQTNSTLEKELAESAAAQN